ncbi:tyrosine-type recombinase/integrase [Aeoliella sp. ICT_H6.2]|uniref:Tyrosine-type recombinase/integrase n=1 Tax=Aeoliella straminimaris TaxID=2954799 RepID=A0A9X2F5M4_9BACT|nr:tyrosine-type recombinase/integrase [Aeoliella straminimaris]MCO6042665.1 tyrosine-type recombinase/integrase [Aeoliella straminimaris]
MSAAARRRQWTIKEISMASIFKRSKRRNEPYLIQYVDHLGKRRTVRGFTDKGLTEELAAKLESEARQRATGLIDPSQDRVATHRSAPIHEHLSAFEESLSDNTEKHVKLTMARVRRVVEGCGFETLGAIEAEEVQSYLRKLRKAENLGHRTYNHYLQAMDAFCYWCVTTKRLLASPLVRLERLNTATDVRHPRRALTSEEVYELVESARSSSKRIQGLSGEQRAKVYLLSYMTGLRRKELSSLTPRSFVLDVSPATVTVEAACSKHRRKDVLPLHPDLVNLLESWLKGLKPSEKLFPRLERKKTWLMVKKDLERVGIAYKTEEGIADFHAAGRHTHITELLRNGVSLPEAKELARHSDVTMTMKYTHIGLSDQAKAVANLPTPQRRVEPATLAALPKSGALQMRCTFCGAKGHGMTSSDTEENLQKRVNPCRGKGFDADRRQLATSDKVEAAGIEPASRNIST